MKSHPLRVSTASWALAALSSTWLYHSRPEGGPLHSSQPYWGFYYNVYSWPARSPHMVSISVSSYTSLFLIHGLLAILGLFSSYISNAFLLWPLSNLFPLSKCSSFKPQNGGPLFDIQKLLSERSIFSRNLRQCSPPPSHITLFYFLYNTYTKMFYFIYLLKYSVFLH